MPSSRRQTRATAGALPSVSAKRRLRGGGALDEQPHRRVPARRRRPVGRVRQPGAGAGSDGTRQATSPATPSGSRLVARTRTSGAGAQQRVGQPGARRRAGARSCPARAAAARRAQVVAAACRRAAGRAPRARRAPRRPPAAPAPGRPAAPGRRARRRPGTRRGPPRRPRAPGASCRTAGPGQRQQPRRAEQPPHLGELRLPPDKRGELHRQVVRLAPRRLTHARQHTTPGSGGRQPPTGSGRPRRRRRRTGPLPTRRPSDGPARRRRRAAPVPRGSRIRPAVGSVGGSTAAPSRHWMTSVACCRTDCGMVSPSGLGGLEVDDEVELVGCSTGRSAGLAPLRILST